MSFSRSFGQYQLRLPADAWVDIESGTSALDRVEAAVRTGEARKSLGPPAVAASISRRPFLPGVDGFWRESLQGKLERQLIRALDRLAEMQLEICEPQNALESALEAIGMGPLPGAHASVPDAGLGRDGQPG